MSDIDNTSYSSYRGNGLGIIYDSLYNKAGFIKESTFLIYYQNVKYGNEAYSLAYDKYFYLKLIFYENGLIELITSIGRSKYNTYTVENDEIKIGYGESNEGHDNGLCIYYYSFNYKYKYGYLVLKRTGDNFSLSIKYNEDYSSDVSTVDIYSKDGNTFTKVDSGILYFKYTTYSGNKSYINKILEKISWNNTGNKNDVYLPVMVSSWNYCTYLYENVAGINYNKYYYLCSSDHLKKVEFKYFDENSLNIFYNAPQKHYLDAPSTFALPKEFELLYLDESNNNIVIFQLSNTNYNGQKPMVYNCNLMRVKKGSDSSNKFQIVDQYTCKLDLIDSYTNTTALQDTYLKTINVIFNDITYFVIGEWNSSNYSYNSNQHKNNAIFYIHIINNEKRNVKETNFNVDLRLLAINVKCNYKTNGIIGWFSELLPNYSSVVLDNGGTSVLDGNDSNKKYGIKQILIKEFAIANNEYSENHFRCNRFKTILNLPLSEYGDNLVDLNNKIQPIKNSKIYFGYIQYKYNNQKRYAFFGFDGYKIVFCLNIVGNNGKVFSSVENYRFTLYQDKLVIKFDSFDFNYANYRGFIPLNCEPNLDTTKREISFNVTYVAVYDKTFTVQPNPFTKQSLIASDENYYYNIKDITISNGEIDEKLVDGKYYLLVPIENNQYELISSIKFIASDNKVYIQANTNINYKYSKIIKTNNYIEINFGDIGYIRFSQYSIVAYGEGLPNDVGINVRVAYPYDSYGDNNIDVVLKEDCLYAIQKSYENATFYDERTSGELITKDLFNYIKDIYNTDNKVHHIRLYFTCNVNNSQVDNYYKLFSLTFYKNNKVELNSYIVNNSSFTIYKGSIFDYDFKNLYSDYSNIMEDYTKSLNINDYIKLTHDNLVIDFTKKYSIFNYMLCNNIQTLQNNYNLNSNNTFINEKEFKLYYFSSSTSLDKKPFYVEKLLEDSEKETFITNNIDKIIQKLKIVFSYLNTFDKYSLSTINENDKISDENLNDETVYIGFIEFQSNKYNNTRYIPILRYNEKSYCFMSTNSYLGDSFNLFNYLYELENLRHNIENKKLYRNDDDNDYDYDHFKYSVNYIIPFDSQPLIENSTGKYYNVILNYALLTFYNDIKINSTISFYSNEQFDYSDDYQVEQLDGFIEGKDDNTFRIIRSIDKIEKIFICYTIGSKLFRNLYILGDITNAGPDYSHYKLNNLIINYKTKDEKIIEIKNSRNEFIVDNYEVHEILFELLYERPGEIFGEKFYIYNYNIENTYYSMNYLNFTYNNVRNEENSKVLSIQVKFKE